MNKECNSIKYNSYNNIYFFPTMKNYTISNKKNYIIINNNNYPYQISISPITLNKEILTNINYKYCFFYLL